MNKSQDDVQPSQDYKLEVQNAMSDINLDEQNTNSDNLDKQSDVNAKTVETIKEPENKQVENTTTIQTINANELAVSPPAGLITQMRLVHSGKILSNIAIVSTILMFLLLIIPIVSMFVVAGYYLVIILISACAIIFTLGTIFLAENNFLAGLWGNTLSVDVLMQYSLTLIPVCFGVSMGASVASLVLLCCGKETSAWRIAVSIITIVMPIVFLLLFVLGVTTQ